MSYREDEKRWKRIQEMLAAEASGRTLRPTVSQRTLFGIPSTVEQIVERIVEEDEEGRMKKRRVLAGAGTQVNHPLEPIFDKRSRVLILGTMPSPKSRETGFYYGHPRNRFWKVLAALFDEPVAITNERRTDQLLRHHIALWDVLASCRIDGASDASIADAVPNDLSRILEAAPIEAVFCTGAKSAELYARLCEASTNMAATRLPSTSPANASINLDELVDSYRGILPHLHEPETQTLDVADVVQLEQDIASSGTSLAELMDRAGLFIAHKIHKAHPHAHVVILCGNGNNGGDGWVAARALAEHGHQVTLICARRAEDLSAQPARDAALEIKPILREQRAVILEDPDGQHLAKALEEADVIVDAILGTGFTGGTVKAPFGEWIRHANRRAHSTYLIAADVPSGLNAQTGAASDPCIVADETVTMMVSKPGLQTTDSSRQCGTVCVAPLAYLEPFLGS